MAKKKIILLAGIVLLIGILFVNTTKALGITPGRTTIDFVPSLEKDIEFSILNNQHENMQVVFVVGGELNESLALYNASTEFLPSEESQSFKYKIKLPNRLEPGLHTGEITALRIPRNANREGTFVGATVAVISELYVYVPYPGKYVDFDLSVLDAEQNSTATFVIPIINRGKVGIGEARAIIEIYTPLNERVATIESDYVPLGAGERTELSARWPINVSLGSYLARVTVFYDGESKTIDKQFVVGANKLSIESILVNQFTLGEIAKLQILVENKWNEELRGVFANLLVFDNEGDTMADVKSASENIPALTKKELIAYWDTVGVAEGEYDGKLFVRYGEKSTDKNLLLKVSQNSMDISGVGYAVRGRAGGKLDLVTVLVIVVIILIIVNLAWFIFFRRVMRRRGK